MNETPLTPQNQEFTNDLSNGNQPVPGIPKLANEQLHDTDRLRGPSNTMEKEPTRGSKRSFREAFGEVPLRTDGKKWKAEQG